MIVCLTFQYRERYVEGCNVIIVAVSINIIMEFQYRERYVEGCNIPALDEPSLQRVKFQYRERYVEGCNTVPLSPWGYWPQMSKMENLGDFSDFRLSAPRALFGIVPS